MTNSSNDLERVERADVHSAVDDHADKYNDPRVQITRRGVLMCVGVLILGMIGSAASIYARKTKLEKTREFWGDDTITALQLGERLQMDSIGGLEFSTVELTAAPGLGHLRHALLDERSYDWKTAADQPIGDKCQGEDSKCVRLKITDPTANRFEPIEICIDLNEGWVGPSDGSRCVQTTPRVKPALGKFLVQLITLQQKRYDVRD